jgi:hypothetical protein
MEEIELTELEVRLFNLLREHAFYKRLKSVVLRPASESTCGWSAKIVGDFDFNDHRIVNDSVRDLQRRVSLSIKRK